MNLERCSISYLDGDVIRNWYTTRLGSGWLAQSHDGQLGLHQESNNIMRFYDLVNRQPLLNSINIIASARSNEYILIMTRMWFWLCADLKRKRRKTILTPKKCKNKKWYSSIKHMHTIKYHEHSREVQWATKTGYIKIKLKIEPTNK